MSRNNKKEYEEKQAGHGIKKKENGGKAGVSGEEYGGGGQRS